MPDQFPSYEKLSLPRFIPEHRTKKAADLLDSCQNVYARLRPKQLGNGAGPHEAATTTHRTATARWSHALSRGLQPIHREGSGEVFFQLLRTFHVVQLVTESLKRNQTRVALVASSTNNSIATRTFIAIMTALACLLSQPRRRRRPHCPPHHIA